MHKRGMHCEGAAVGTLNGVGAMSMHMHACVNFAGPSAGLASNGAQFLKHCAPHSCAFLKLVQFFSGSLAAKTETASNWWPLRQDTGVRCRIQVQLCSTEQRPNFIPATPKTCS